MILELDIGNSRIKWRQLDEVSATVLAKGTVADIAALFSGPAGGTRPQLVRACSVRADASLEQVTQQVAERWDLTPVVARVTRSCAGVSNQYQDPARLGIDRWLAMLAAFQRAAGPCLVIDAGTAITIDILDADGRHQGGYILPGLELMASALTANTGIRLGAGASYDSIAPGHSTEDAIYNGSLASVLALIRQTSAEREALGESPRVYLCGGNAEVLIEKLAPASAEWVPDLVLDGLGLACAEG